MLPPTKLRPEVLEYLDNSLCSYKEKFGLDEYTLRFARLLKKLGEPPKFTTLRINLLKASAEEIRQKLKTVLSEQYAKRQMDFPDILLHPQVDDCLIVSSEGPNFIMALDKEVIVDTACGAAVLRGADIYAQGILAAPSGMQIGDRVSVYADIDGKCRWGLTKIFNEPKVLLGNGIATTSRRDIFCNDKKPSGIGIYMMEPLFVAPSLSNILVDLVFPQNIPSVVCVHVLDSQEGETVLDMCAAPGGKTTHIAALMKNKGRVVALDKSKNKISKIQENANHWDLSCINVYCFDGRKAVSQKDDLLLTGPPPYSRGSFDRVLLDAPCSGLGRRPMLTSDLSLPEIKSYPALQRKLFENAVELLKDNGTLVYSTCTINLKENEDVVAWALLTFPQLELVQQNPHLGGIGLSGSLLDDDKALLLQRFGPSIQTDDILNDVNEDTIGFFIAKFVKRPKHDD